MWLWDKLFGKEAKEFQHSENGSLTDDERNYIVKALNQKKPECPDCGEGYFLAGPCGGASQNVRCEKCSAEFNITTWGSFVIGERITPRGVVDETRRQFYRGKYNG